MADRRDDPVCKAELHLRGYTSIKLSAAQDHDGVSQGRDVFCRSTVRKSSGITETHLGKILLHHALKAAKRLFGIPNFRYYAIADGVKEIFAKYSGQIFYRRKIPKEFNPQMKLWLY